MQILKLLGFSALLFAACSCSTRLSSRISAEIEPASAAVLNESRPTVSGSEALAIAAAYVQFRWEADEANAFHGIAPDGIRVDTPDIEFVPGGDTRPGWWKPRPTEKNLGMPYKWGGFDTPDTFREGLAAGKFAGDIYTPAKRHALYAGVSEHAVGIDCSGFVSRCWRLDRPHSTRMLPEICEELPSFDDLRPGDALNIVNDHCLLFSHFGDRERTFLVCYEAGSPPSWKVLRNRINVAYLKESGYVPLRYRGMRDQ